jgi:uncharacterized FAD-dependent dehydrogenase
MKVVELHGGKKPHLGTLSDRLLDVIEDFMRDAESKDIQITFAEVIGTLHIVANSVTMTSLGADHD